jgi:hypothetical protein
LVGFMFEGVQPVLVLLMSRGRQSGATFLW